MTNEQLQEDKQKLIKALESIEKIIECIDGKHYTAIDAINDIRSTIYIYIGLFFATAESVCHD